MYIYLLLNGITFFNYICIFLLKLQKKIAATANIFDGRFCGDFPVNSKLITYKAYMFFPCNIYLCTCSENLWGLQATCNPCHNYVLVTGYPLLHGVFLHFLWGKHLQCMYDRTSMYNSLLPRCSKQKFCSFVTIFFKNLITLNKWWETDLPYSAYMYIIIMRQQDNICVNVLKGTKNITFLLQMYGSLRK